MEAHCEAAVKAEVGALEGVDTKRVAVEGTALDDAAIRAAIEEGGYEAA